MNNAEDTLWLSELSNDLLQQAIIWPKLMIRICQPLGALTMLLFVASLSQPYFVASSFVVSCVLLVVVVLVSYKVQSYQADIRLITNELNRREGNKT